MAPVKLLTTRASSVPVNVLVIFSMEEPMNIIAKTNDGFLINATEKELSEIIKSVTGMAPKEINIGQKIPAIDYATTGVARRPA